MRRNRVVFAAAAACSVELTLGLYAHATVRTWSATTSSTTNKFSDAANWGNNAIVSGSDELSFVSIASANLSPSNDITGLTLVGQTVSSVNQHGIAFTGAQAYTLGGNDITILDNSSTAFAINNTASALQTIGNNLFLGGSAARIIISNDAGGMVLNGSISNVSVNNSSIQFESDSTSGAITINGSVAMGSSTGQLLNAGNGFNATDGTIVFNNNITGSATFNIGRGVANLKASTDLAGAVAIGSSSKQATFSASLILSHTGAMQNATAFSILRNDVSGNGQTGGTDSLLIAATGTQRDQNITIYAQTNSGVTVAVGGTTGLGAAGTAIFGGNIVYGLSTPANNIVNRTLQLQATEGTVTFKGTIKEGSAGQSQGLLSLNKTGAGTVILTGNNTYSGTTSVSAGTLLVNNTAGSGTSGGAVSVGADATIGGTGTISGTLALSGTASHLSQLNPGGSTHAGALTVKNNVTLGDYSSLAISLNGSTSNELIVNGNLNLSSTLDNLAFTGSADGISNYVLAAYTGTLTGTFDTVTNLPAYYSLSYGGGQVVAVAPEPASCVTVVAVQLGALALRRRRRVAQTT